MVIEATLCHIISGERILLKKANRGVSVGKWNAPGGKLEKNETPEKNARREVLEETGLRVGALFYHGTITYVMDGGRSLHTRAHVFSSRRFSGKPRSSTEGRVRWFSLRRLPYESMWDDDRYWIPLMLIRSSFDATFTYDDSNRRVTGYEIHSREPST